MRASRRVPQIERRLLTLGWAATGVPLVTSAIALARSGWAPAVDNALIAAMTVDSISLDPPLVGMPTSLGLEDGVPLSHPGPLGFWLLAIPTKILGEPGHGLIVGAVLVALASIAVIASLLRHRGDALLELLTLGLVAAMVVSISGRTFASPLNPHLGILPLLLCMVAVWGVLSGHRRQLFVVVIAGSVAAQVHLGYVLLVAALVALAGVSLAADLVRSKTTVGRRLIGRDIAGGVLLGLLLWIGPILDQLFGTRNLTRLVQSQSGAAPAAGLDHGLEVAVEMSSLPPRWILGQARDQALGDPGSLRIILSVIALTYVVGLLVWALRRRDRGLSSLAIVAMVSVAVSTLTSARVVGPGTPSFVVEHAVLYRLFWWPVGVLFSLTLVWGTVRIAAALRGAAMAPARSPRLPTPVLASVIAGIAVLVQLAYAAPLRGLEEYFDAGPQHAEAIAALPGPPARVVLRLEPDGATAGAGTGSEGPASSWDLGLHQRYGNVVNLVAQLRLHGIEVRFADVSGRESTFMLGYRTEHPQRGDEAVDVLLLVGPPVHHEDLPGYRRISVAGAAADEPVHPFTTPSAVYVPS